MRHIVVFALFLLVLVRAQFRDPPFSSGCFLSSDRTEHLKYICNSKANQECERPFEHPKVEIIKYECRKKSSSVVLRLDELREFEHLRVLDITSIGIFFIAFEPNTPFSVNQPATNFQLQVAILKATKNRLKKISHEILNYMPRLTEIDYSYNEILYLNLNEFNMNNDISIINCSYNQIENIVNGTFSTLLKLKKLNLSHNKIVKIDENAFGNGFFPNEPQVNMLNLSSNPLTDFDFRIFLTLLNLDVLDMSNTRIQRIIDGCFENNTKMKVLILAKSSLEEFSSKLISPLHELELLDLSNTRIQKINDGCFANNPKMKELNLMGTSLKKFSFNTFSPQADLVEVHLPSHSIEEPDISCINSICHFKNFDKDDFFENIRVFKASGNRDQNISKLLDKIGLSVIMMDLSRNSIETLTNNMLLRFSNLRHLNLSHSNISKIENNAFLGQANSNLMILLDLSFNFLEEIDNVIFPIGLQRLNLAGNRLTKLDNVIPRCLPKLRSLQISKNQFDSQYVDDFLEKWKITNVTINTVIDIEDDIRIDAFAITPTTQSIVTDDSTAITIATPTLTTEESSSTLDSTSTSDSTTTLAPSKTATFETNESENKSDLSINLHISTNMMYVIIGVLIVITIIVVAVILYFCRRKPITSASIPLSTVSTNLRTNVNTLTEEPPYEEIKDPLPSAYAVTTLNHMSHYENSPACTMTLDRYQDVHQFNNSLQSNEYANIYHHYSTVSKPKFQSHFGAMA
ncbi:protein artichoke-like [Sitodiplosis mosellana]|uniref:protein artichoke-like n=1 Tax=Sitodiplosis mosellana TaxID=263140 RepID=UPI0024445002|nr:protein artichoke-like [Sitodiplosis mosellana]